MAHSFELTVVAGSGVGVVDVEFGLDLKIYLFCVDADNTVVAVEQNCLYLHLHC